MRQYCIASAVVDVVVIFFSLCSVFYFSLAYVKFDFEEYERNLKNMQTEKEKTRENPNIEEMNAIFND